MVILPHSYSALREQYARNRVASPRSAAADEAKNRRKENMLLCAFHR